MNVDGCKALADLKILPRWHECCDGCYDNWHNNEDWEGEYSVAVGKDVYHTCCTAVGNISDEHGDESIQWEFEAFAHVWQSPIGPMLCPWSMP